MGHLNKRLIYWLHISGFKLLLKTKKLLDIKDIRIKTRNRLKVIS